MDILSTELAEAGIAIYPNPFEEEVIIQLSNSPVTPIKLELTDITGRVILKTLMNQKEYVWDGTDARGHKVPAGIYLVHFEKDGKYYHIKIVKGK